MPELGFLFLVGIIALLVLFTYFIPIRLWIAALSSGAPVGLGAIDRHAPPASEPQGGGRAAD